jgi:hypothetical protein
MHKFCPASVTTARRPASHLEKGCADRVMIGRTEGVGECAGGSSEVLAAVLRGLRGRRRELVAALDGRSLRIAVTLADPGPPETSRILLTAAGNALLMQPENLNGREFDPHIEFRCSTDDLRAFVLGHVSTADAIENATVLPHVDLASYDGVRSLVADELRRVLRTA